VEQSPVTLPLGVKHDVGEIKPPDFLVGIPRSALAFDVNAKRIYDGCTLVDATEHEALLQFEQFLLHRRLVGCLLSSDDPHAATSS
jgi:hypothetical protein